MPDLASLMHSTRTDNPHGVTATQTGASYNTRSVSSTTIAAVNDWIWANTSAGSFTIQAPANPNVGDIFVVADAQNTFNDNPVTIDRNGSNIVGASENMSLDMNNVVFRFEYRGGTQGWRVTI